MNRLAEQLDDDLLRLLSEHADGEISAADRDCLADILRSDPAARAAYFEFTILRAGLWQKGGRRQAVEELVGEELSAVSEQPRASDGVALVSPAKRSLLQWASRHPVRPAIAIAVAITLMVLGAMAVTPVSKWIAGGSEPAEKDAKTPVESDHVAILNNWRGANWLEDTRPPLNNPRLKVGKRLVIESGMIEVKYLTGARVVIEGPAEFYVGGTKAQRQKAHSREDNSRGRKPADATNSGFLSLGSLVARVEGKEAQGFAIDTPSARVEDFGTEFGVEVKRSGAAEVVVLSGEVDVVRDNEDGPAQRVRLVKDEGAFVASSSARITRRKSVDEKFVAAMKNRLMTIPDPAEVVVEVPGTIFYESFESVPVPLNRDRNHPHFGLGGNLPAGWTDGRTNHEVSGKFSTPFGAQAAFTNGKPFMTTPEILAEVLTAGTTYTLTFNVARRTDHRGNYLVELLAGETILASTTGTPTKSDFSESDQIVFTPDASHAELLGETLVIRLSTNGQLQPHFDNVRLVAEKPEAEEEKEPRIETDIEKEGDEEEVADENESADE